MINHTNIKNVQTLL